MQSIFETNLDQNETGAAGKPSLPPPRIQHHHGKHKHLGNDISIEYHGRVPKRNTGYSMSRDSGVNCIGLTEASYLPRIDRTPNTRNHSNEVILNNECHLKHSIPQAASTPNNNLVVHKATAHDTITKLPQDSGFSSPRIEAEKSQHNNSCKILTEAG